MTASNPRLLLATDFSPWAKQAEEWAVSLATLWKGQVTVVTILEFPPGLNPDYPVNQQYLTDRMREAAEQLTDCKRRMAQQGLEIATRIETGMPSEQVVGVAQVEQADLIILGTRGQTGLAHVLLGSTAERVIRTAPCPVLAVRAERQDEERKGGLQHDPLALERILVPIDFSDCSLDALEYGALVAQRSNASIRVLHVLEPISYGLDFTLPHVAKRDHDRAVITKRLSTITAALTSTGLRSDFVVSGGLPADSILNAAAAPDVGLIVMGTHGRRGLSHALFGSVAEFVLRKSTCPVLTVRSPKFHPGHRRLFVGDSMSNNV